ncbi:hypothetical protein CYMTET_19824 [Cymbomonas tetramitiformis]|uniref:Uncharacterized protein n=1 Tax=Cymbomonas tetramitiformis TaxID=36881 RepID=A0AAE0G5B9_9CHLO|nr:hypothetical protein CYMTET_19824 [Cymbomonas tetramitiformis]
MATSAVRVAAALRNGQDDELTDEALGEFEDIMRSGVSSGTEEEPTAAIQKDDRQRNGVSTDNEQANKQEEQVWNAEVISTLAAEYRARAEIRRSYGRLFAYLLFVIVYISIVSLQSNPEESYHTLESVKETLLPVDQNSGEYSKFFESNEDIKDWLLAKVGNFWVAPSCGDGDCDFPLEFQAWGYHGCKPDCDARESSTIKINLVAYSYLSNDADVQLENISWNICTITTYDGNVLCQYSEEQTFDVSSYASAEVQMPDSDWNLRLSRRRLLARGQLFQHQRRLQQRPSDSKAESEWSEWLSSIQPYIQLAESEPVESAQTCLAHVQELLSAYPTTTEDCRSGMTEDCCMRYQRMAPSAAPDMEHWPRKQGCTWA